MNEYIALKQDWKKSIKNSFLVNGIAFDVRNATDQDILEMLVHLPSGLSDRTRTHTNWRYTPVQPASSAEFKAYDADNEFIRTGNEAVLDKAIKLYLEAAQSYENLKLKQQTANMYSLAAQAFCKFPANPFIEGKFATEHAAEFFDKAVTLHNLQGHADFAYRDCDKLYNALAETSLAYLEHAQSQNSPFSGTVARQRAEQYSKRLAVEAIKISEYSRRMQGSIDYMALRVEQKEIGFSDVYAIGTDNVSQCVALAVQSEQGDKSVAVAHIDYETDVSSLSEIFSRLPDGKKSIRIVGARFEDDPKSSENLCRVVRMLANYDVNIISADVLQGDQGPSTVVISPHDFQMHEAVPAAFNESESAGCAYSLLTMDKYYPLRVSFDTRQGMHRAPIFVDSFIVEKLNSLCKDSDFAQMYKNLKREGLFDIGLATGYLLGMNNACADARGELDLYARRMLPSVLYEHLPEFPLYIGANTGPANRKLVDMAAEIYKLDPDTFNLGDLDVLADLGAVDYAQQVQLQYD